MDSARALIARGWGVSLVSRCLRVSRAQLHVILRRTDDWMDGRRSRHTDDTDVLLRIHHVIGELPTYGYHRVWALLRRQAELDGMPAINAKRVYRIMRQNALLLERKPAVPPSKRAHTGRVAVKESNQRWCSDGFEFRCDNGEKLRVTFALDCCDREALHWAVTTGGFNSETVQDVMLGAVERRFGNDLPSSPVEWLTDNGSCYRANETRQFARMLGLEPKNTAVRSPESNGIAESFVKTIKREYISIMPKPDGLTAAKNLAEAFEHYNCQRQDYWPFWGCGRFPGLSGDKTCLLKKKKSAPLSFISNMVRSWLPSYANWATLRKGICVVGAAHGKQVVA